MTMQVLVKDCATDQFQSLPLYLPGGNIEKLLGWQVVVVSAGGLVQAGGGAVFPVVITDTGWGGLVARRWPGGQPGDVGT